MPGHGALTKAGKVRKKTPFVEPQDEFKKKLNGRAGKRKTFGKRYAIILASQETKKKIGLNKQPAN